MKNQPVNVLRGGGPAVTLPPAWNTLYCSIRGMGAKSSPSGEGFRRPVGPKADILRQKSKVSLFFINDRRLKATVFQGGCAGRISSGRAKLVAEATAFRRLRTLLGQQRVNSKNEYMCQTQAGHLRMNCAVAISGGVDSMMTAHLLQEAGHRVMGVHFTHGFESTSDGSVSKVRAARIAERLGIPFYQFNLAQVFKTHVIDYFVGAYSSGITPNPCMQCNPMVKFGALFEAAQKLGAHKLATGHYARIEAGPGETPYLLRGVDPLKDQSYFLARLRRAQLSRTIFPLGALRKQAVKEMAAKAGFSTLVGSESQDVCFCANDGYHAFLEKQPGFSAASGEIVDLNGNILGRHGGLHHYTIGQRRGINCPAADPLYVIALDSIRNRLIVGPKAARETTTCKVVDINWLMNKMDAPFTARVKVRYRHQPVLAQIQPAGTKRASIVFEKPQAGVAPGQGAVFYDKDRVLGGGWIEKPKGRPAGMKTGR